MERFRDRVEAGRMLAELLRGIAGSPDTIVLALPRGGVPVGYEISRALDLPLDVFVVRKLGVPGHEELAVGAIATGGVRVVDWSTVRRMSLSEDDVEEIAERERAELARRERAYREGAPPLNVRGKIGIVTDDGLATGATMRAAIEALRRLEPARIIVAVPVASPDIVAAFGQIADEIVCPLQPDPLYAVGLWYEDFSQTTDDEVRDLLRRARGDVAAHNRSA